MAGDYRVRFYGDLGNLAQFSQSIRGAFSQIRTAYQSSGSAPVRSIGAPSLSTSKVTTQIDAYNRTLVQSGQVFHRYVSGYVTDMNRLQAAERNLYKGLVASGGTSFGPAGNTRTAGKSGGITSKAINPVYSEFLTGQYKVTTGDLDKIEAAQARLLPAQREFLKLQQTSELRRAEMQAKFNAAEVRSMELEKQRMRLAERRTALTTGAYGNTYINPKTNAASVRLTPLPSEYNKVVKYIKDYINPNYDQQAFVSAQARHLSGRPDADIQQALRSIRGLDTVDSQLAAVQKEYKAVENLIKKLDASNVRLENKLTAKEKGILKKYSAELKALGAALNSTPPIARDLDYFLGNSKDFRKQFVKEMALSTPYVPKTTSTDPAVIARNTAARETFSKQLLARGIDPASIQVTRDLEKGIYRISGAVKDARGYTAQWSTTLDNNLRKVERWGGSLRGSGGFLRQTVRDFQKVVEWTIATTVVFGTLGVAIGSISKINQINADLQRFSLTAQTSGDETKRAFQDIADIAYRTATPLQDLTAVMDDIALATRRAGQTSEEWRTAMNALSESVGILTNLTGVDTVRATDLLSAAYKQLQIAPEQLIPVLNKVTAVAGGNAQAIEDIISALGSVSEAAQAAGLTLDQQIAAVQTLSQVTNKSATEVATSFKNLFGSISSAGAEKALSKFGITTRKASGELRDFLDIYKDIYDARQAGKISEGQLQDVLRGISGGPRRAPDAAALLSNIPLIFEQLDKAAGASNEALIANAKVLDTNSAKLQQLRTQFDTAIVESFTDAVNRLVKTFVDLGTVVAGLFGGVGIVSGFAEGAAQIGPLILAIALATKGVGLLSRGFRGLRSDFTGLINLEKTLGSSGIFSRFAKYNNPQLVKQGQLPPVSGYRRIGSGANQRYVPLKAAANIPFPANITVQPQNDPLGSAKAYGRYGLQNIVGSTKGRIGLGIGGGLAAGAALGAVGAATGNIGELAAAGQGLGITLAMLGGPVGIAAGGTLAALSTGLAIWNEEQQKTKEKQDQLKFAILDNIKALEEQRKAQSDAEKAQRESLGTINELKDKQSLTADETNRLSTAYNTYIDAAFKLSDANKQIAETTKSLLANLGPLSSQYQTLISQIQSGAITDPKVLKDLSSKLTSDVLGISVPGAATVPTFDTKNLPSTTVVAQQTDLTPIGLLAGALGNSGPVVNAKDFYKEIQQGGLRTTLDYLNGTKGLASGAEFNSQIAELMRTQLLTADEAEKNTEEYQKAVLEFGNWVSKINAPNVQLTNTTASFAAQIQAQSALGILQGEAATNAAGRLSVSQELINRLGQLERQQQQQGQRPLAENAQQRPNISQDTISQFLFGQGGKGGFLGGSNGPNTLKVSTDQAKELFTLITQLDPAFSGFAGNVQLFNAAVYKFFADRGIEIDGLRADAEAVGDIFAELKDNIKSSVIEGQKGLYEELLSLRAQKQGGEFVGKGAEYNAERDQVLALISAYESLGTVFQENADYLDEFAKVLGTINGLQGIQLQSTENLLPTLINYAKTLGLTGDQIRSLVKKVEALITVTRAIDGIKARFGIRADLPTAQVKAFLVALRATILAAVNSGNMGGGAERNSYSQIKAIDAALGQLSRADSLTKQVDALLRSGGGSSGPYKTPSTGSGGSGSRGGGGGSTAYNKPGLLDIPDEFHNADRSVASLLKEAVANAKSLQSKIPGETKANRKEIVAILDGTKKLLQTKGIGEEYLRRAMEELAAQIKRQTDLLAKADTIRRIRVGGGDFSAIANVPVNKTTGISLAGSNAINVTLNLNGTVLTPAQFAQFANQIAAALKRQLAS